jgi:hypothetical protein
LPRNWRCLVAAIAVAVTVVGSGQPGRPSSRVATSSGGTVTAAGPVRVLLVCNGSTSPCPAATHYLTVQGAVDAAHPGDWVLIWPGVYHEHNAEGHAGVWVTVSGLHIRGLSRTGVIIDGSNHRNRMVVKSVV